ncbi:MAG: tetratricopeptide repeat protein [Deltaproteobacteria bacterium]|nr:tetratricopeptide repeat protein [Deltaproteobacteria bacterium]
MAALEEEKGKGASGEITRGARHAARIAEKAARKAADRGKTPVAVNRLAEKATSTSVWIKERRKALIGVTAAAVVIACGLFSWRYFANKTDREAAKLLEKAVSTAHALVLSEESALDQETSVETYPSFEEKANQSIKSYEKVIAEYPKADAAIWSKLGKANALFELGKYDQARKVYIEALETAEDNSFARCRALEGIGYVLEAGKKYAEAAEYFMKIALIADGAYQPESEYHVARMQLAQGKRDAAEKKLVDLLKELKKREGEQIEEHAWVRSEVEVRLRELGHDPDEIKVESKKAEPPASGDKSK